MPETIENYIPQAFLENQKKYAFYVWSVGFLIVLGWIVLIVAAPVAKAIGFEGFADSIYKFFSYVCHQIAERSFHIHGHSFAVCSRCFGFYGGFFSGLIIYPVFRALDEIESFPRFWLFLAMIPMGIDWALGFFEIWENTLLSRAVTGAILGIACAFFIVPALAEISRWFVDRKIKRLSR